MLRVAIVDDCIADLARAARIVEETAKEHHIDVKTDTIGAPSFLLDDMKEGALYDIFILDIEMSEMTGVELARKIQEIYGIAHIIFTTCHVRYAPQGYEVRAERFVLKDRLEQKLPEAFLFAAAQIIKARERYYIASSAEGMTKIPYCDMIKIEKLDSKYSLIYTSRGQFKTRCSLSCLMDQLHSDEFIYVNKGIIVNLNHINTITPDRQIYLSSGLMADMSRSRNSAVKQRMLDYYMPGSDPK